MVRVSEVPDAELESAYSKVKKADLVSIVCYKERALRDALISRGDLCKMLEREIKKYKLFGVAQSIKRNKHMNKFKGSGVPENTIDAILVDFVNFIAVGQGIDLGLKTTDIKND